MAVVRHLFAAMKSNVASYKRAAVLSASPEGLILLLYDGALDAMRRAKEGFEIDEVRLRNETVSNNLIKAQNIFAELQRSLRADRNKQFSDTMFDLYGFYNTKLNEANLKKSPEPIDTVVELFSEIRGAWAEMLSKQGVKAQSAPIQQQGVGGGISLRA